MVRKKSEKRNTQELVSKVGFTCGSFDLCHTGHVLMFKDCKEVCDKLIVGLQVNPNLDREDKNKPIQSLDERYLMLKSIRYVDEVIPYETEKDLYNLLLCLKPDVRIIGADWQGKKFTGDDLPIEIHYNKRSHNYSTTNLRKRIYKAK